MALRFSTPESGASSPQLKNAQWQRVDVGRRLAHSDLSGFLGLEIYDPNAAKAAQPRKAASQQPAKAGPKPAKAAPTPAPGQPKKAKGKGSKPQPRPAPEDNADGADADADTNADADDDLAQFLNDGWQLVDDLDMPDGDASDAGEEDAAGSEAETDDEPVEGIEDVDAVMLATGDENLSGSDDEEEREEEADDAYDIATAALEGAASTEPSTKRVEDVSAWAQFGLHEQLLEGLRDLGFATPTPIQAQSLPAAIFARR